MAIPEERLPNEECCEVTLNGGNAVMATAPRTASRASTAVWATVIGNSLEWFDFSVYAFFAPVIGKHFFPPGSDVLGLMDAFAVFGIGLLGRPLGAVFFGRLGDRSGRKLGLLISIPLMGLGTVAMGVTPSYSSIGVAAPLLLVLCRLLQGFSAGGEVGTAMAFLSEWAPPNRRALYSSLQQFSTLLGTTLGSGCAALITRSLTPAELSQWGWRMPFLVGGLVIAPVGFFLLNKAHETPVFANVSTRRMAPLPGTSGWVLGAKSVALSAAWVVCFYIYLIYLPSFIAKYSGVSAATALSANTAGLATMMLSIPLSGAISDRVGRKPPLLAAGLLSIIVPYPVFALLIHQPSTLLVYLIFVTTGALTGIFAGVVPATMCELFPTLSRATGVSVSFGIATAIFGGFAPLIATWLITFSGSPLSPAYYLVAAALVSAITIFHLPETARELLTSG